MICRIIFFSQKYKLCRFTCLNLNVIIYIYVGIFVTLTKDKIVGLVSQKERCWFFAVLADEGKYFIRIWYNSFERSLHYWRCCTKNRKVYYAAQFCFLEKCDCRLNTILMVRCIHFNSNCEILNPNFSQIIETAFDYNNYYSYSILANWSVFWQSF